MAAKPYLLYVYPWMPFPRRVIIYLREKGIPPSLVTIVEVSGPQDGNDTKPSYVPRPKGSLPILAIPSSEPGGYILIRQSIAIMNYLDILCDAGAEGFPKSKYSMRGSDLLSRARETELMCLADQLTESWNPVRTFGTAASTMSIPAAAKEMLKWVHRSMATIEGWWADRDFAYLKDPNAQQGPTMAEIVLYQFLEFVDDCYGVDMTVGDGKTQKDAYGREVVEAYPKLQEFFMVFRT
jgi:glutathione S-transferase